MSLGHGASIVRDGLVLHLDAAGAKSYPGSGTTWTDLSGNGNNGTLVNGVGYSSDNNGALTFDGTNDLAQIPRSYPSSYTDNYTLSCWLYVPDGVTWYNQGAATGIIGAGSYAGSFGIVRNPTNNEIASGIRVQSNFANLKRANYTITRDTWWNVYSVWDGSNISIYVNGEFGSQTSVSADTNFDSGNLVVGGSIAFGGSNGGIAAVNIGNVYMYNRALTEAEILQNFEATRGRYGI